MKFKKLYNILKHFGIGEICFAIKNSIFKEVWIGTTIKDNEINYWIGINDKNYLGKEFSTVDELVNSKVFNGKSLKEI